MSLNADFNTDFSRMQIHEFHERIRPLVNFPKLALSSGQLKIPKQMSFQIQVRKNVYKNHKNEPLEFAFLVADKSLPYLSTPQTIFSTFLPPLLVWSFSPHFFRTCLIMLSLFSFVSLL